jgi:hypothetical protein
LFGVTGGPTGIHCVETRAINITQRPPNFKLVKPFWTVHALFGINITFK